MPEEKKDYKAKIEELSYTHILDYLYGYIRCLHSHNHIKMEEAMDLIDYAEELKSEKEVKP